MTYLFAYGTLRRGGRAEVTSLCEAIYAGPARASGILFRVEDHPGMIASSAERDEVIGEVFQLLHPDAAWPVLDAYEGDDYGREVISARTDDGQILQAWAYFYRGETSEKSRIVSGDFFRDI